MQVSRRLGDIVSRYRPVLDKYETLYKRFHRYPELSLQEINTSLKIIQHLNELGFEVVSNIGGHGIVGVLRNNPDHNSKVVLLRADMDALPIEEKTGLEYASTEKMVDTDGVEKPVMHACGHDVHITALLAAAELLMAAKNEWRGTAVVLFQPNEERAGGARAMVEDGLYEKIPKPNVVLGGHIGPVLSGMVATRPGAMAAAADSFKVTLRGKGGHGAEPHRTIDPVVMAASIILRLQTIVSREVDPMQTAVVTVGSIQAGGAENVIPEEAVLKVNVRAFDEAVREKVLAAVRRIIRAECEASAAPEPVIEPTTRFPLLWNDETVTQKLSHSFTEYFGDSFNGGVDPVKSSEDFGILGSSINVPSCFWVYGGVEKNQWEDAVKSGRTKDIPGNHTSLFAPVIQPTLKTAVDAYAVAALTWLS